MIFYKYIPIWMSNTLNGKLCSKCKNELTKIHITGIGIKQIKESFTTFVEFQCPNCKHEARFSFENILNNSIEKLCFMLLEQVQKQKKLKKSISFKSPNKNKGPMTDQEVNKFLKELKSVKIYDDFLKIISAHHLIEPDQKK